MTPELLTLTATAATIGLVHTLAGPDHYVPFIVIAKARQWGPWKTSLITVLCGLGHVLSSVVLGFVGIAIGVAVAGVEAVESIRGDLAAWLLTGFGLAYLLWGIRRAIRNRPHTHRHLHQGDEHEHEHCHHEDHVHVHDQAKKPSLTPWILFTIFLFGPCEPLIPLLMYPAAQGTIAGVALVAGVFAVVTISTMLACVLVATHALKWTPGKRIERYSHAMAGFAIFACGIAIHMGL